MNCLGITWWQWWIIIMITINTVVNLTVFVKGRKLKKDE